MAFTKLCTPLHTLFTISDTSRLPQGVSFSPGDLDRFNLYAPLVKDISCPINHPAFNPLRQIKANSQSAAPLPNLVHIRVYLALSDQIAFHASLPPNLHTLDVCFRDSRADQPSETVVIPSYIFYPFSSLAVTSLEKVWWTNKTCEAMARFLQRNASTLTAVDFTASVDFPRSVAVLAALSELPRLRELSLSKGWTTQQAMPFPCPPSLSYSATVR